MMRKKLFPLYLITFTVAACSILYELLLANTLSLMAGSTVVWYSVTIGAYLGAMGIGAFAKRKIFPKKSTTRKLFNIEIILSLLGANAALAIFFSHSVSIFLIAHNWGQWGVAVFFAMGFLMIVAVGFFSGIELPLLMEIGNSLSSGTKKISNRVLGVDYFGSLAGAMLFPLFFLPRFSSQQIGFIVAIVNLMMALVVLRLFQRKSKLIMLQTISAAMLFVILIFCFVKSDQIEQYFAKKYYYYLDSGKNIQALFSKMDSFPMIERTRSSYQQIDIMEPIEFSPSDILVNAYLEAQTDEEIVDERMLFLNGDWQLATYTEQIYHEYFAHVPIGVSRDVPQKILVLGGGDGMLVRELLKYDRVKHIVHVELDDQMIELAKSHPVISIANKGALLDDRVKILIGDAFHFVQNTEEKFDAIYIDFPVPADYNTSKIYSREFYSFVRNVLNDNGLMTMYAPGIGAFTEFDEEGNIVANEEKTPWFHYYHTLKSAGFKTVAPYLSRLEIDNPEAHQLANVLIEEQESGERKQQSPFFKIDQELVEQAKQEKVEEMMKKHVLNLQEGFIIVKKEKIHTFTPVEHDVDTMINLKRLQLAFSVSYTKEEEIKWNYVNSIMKPTLPNSSAWRIRFPYNIE